MDFSELKPAERIIDILHPKTKQPTGIKVTVLSMEDDRVKKVKRKILDERLRLEARGKNFKSDDIEENKMTLMFALVTGWEWGKNAEGEEAFFGKEKPTFNLAKFREVLDALPWFSNQIQEAVSDDESFF